MPGSIGDCVHVEVGDEGAHLRISPDARRFSLAEVIAHVLSLGIPEVDFEAVARAYRGADGASWPITKGGDTTRRVRSAARREGFLVVCGDPRLARAISASLLVYGLPVRCVESPDAAMREISAWGPDLVVLTQPVGSKDGLPVCRQVRANPGTEGTPIILVPSVATREKVLEGIRAGVTDMVILPVHEGTLLRKVTRIFRGIGKGPAPGAGQEVEKVVAPLLAEEREVMSDGRVDPALLAKKVDRLLAVPAVVHCVMAITQDSKTGARDLAVAVQSDPAVSATVLRRANSALLGTTGRTFNMQESIVRLGFAQTRSIVMAMSMIRLFSKTQKTPGFNRLDFWIHSLAAAVAAKFLAPKAAVASDMAFTAALLHDIGKIILDEYATEVFGQATLLALRETVAMRVAEDLTLGTNHAAVGAAVLETWRFAQPIISAVAYHHGVPEGLGGGDAQLCRLVQVADLLAKSLGEGHGGDMLLEELPDATWNALGLATGIPSGFAKGFDDELLRSQDFLGATITPPEPPGELCAAAFLDEGGAPVSVAGLALDRAGVRRLPLRSAEDAMRIRPGTVRIGVARAETTERLDAVLGCFRAAPALAAPSLIGILPAGQVPPPARPGVTVFVEPYDRIAFLQALPAR